MELEEHLDFWILVAGLTGESMLRIFIIKLHGNTVLTVTAVQLFYVAEDKRTKLAGVRGPRVMEQQFCPCKYNENMMVLVLAQPPPLKSLCRTIVRNNAIRKQGIVKNIRLKKMLDKTNFRKYIM